MVSRVRETVPARTASAAGAQAAGRPGPGGARPAAGRAAGGTHASSAAVATGAAGAIMVSRDRDCPGAAVAAIATGAALQAKVTAVAGLLDIAALSPRAPDGPIAGEGRGAQAQGASGDVDGAPAWLPSRRQPPLAALLGIAAVTAAPVGPS